MREVDWDSPVDPLHHGASPEWSTLYGTSYWDEMTEEQRSGVRVGGPDGPTELRAGLVVRAVGHRGRPLAGLPFDEETGTVPHHGGRRGRPSRAPTWWAGSSAGPVAESA